MGTAYQVGTVYQVPGPGAGLVTRHGQCLEVVCAGGWCGPGGRGMTPGAGVGSGALTGVQGPVAGSGQELAGEGDTWPHPGLGQIPASGGQGSLGWQGLAARRGRGCGSTLASDGVWLTERLCPPSPEDGRQQLWVDLKIHEPCSGQHIWFIKIAPSERRKAAPHPTLHQGLGASWLGPQLPLLCPPPIPSQRAPARPVPSLSPRPPWGRPPPKARPRPTRSGQAQGPRWPPAPRLGPHTLLPPGDRGLVQRTPCRALPLPAGGVPRGQRRRSGAEALPELPEGGLHGENGAQEGFRKRWFTMDDRRLMYFKDPLDAFARGEVFIGSRESGYTVLDGLPPSTQGHHWPHGITIVTPERRFLLACETETEQQAWVAAFRKVVDRPMLPQEYAVEAHFKHKP